MTLSGRITGPVGHKATPAQFYLAPGAYVTISYI